MMDPARTQAMQSAPMADPNRTLLGATPFDPNRTIMGNAPSLNMTATIKPVQCPVCRTFNPPGLIYCGECGLIFEMALEGDAFGAPSVQLPVLVDSSGREHRLRPGDTVLGRQGDLIFEDTRVSRRHAQITSSGDSLTVEDLGSTNGTSLNGQRLGSGQKQSLKNGDKVSLGGLELTLGLPGEVNRTLAAFSGKTSAIAAAPTVGQVKAVLVMPDKEHPLRVGATTFGRRDGNDLVLSDPHISGKHGVFEADDSGVYLTDTGSTNGTMLNDARLTANSKTQLREGDRITLGGLTLTVKLKS